MIDGWSVVDWIRELANDDPEVEQLFWQIIAALFRPGHTFNKAVLLYSATESNGKGTFVELLRSLVGAGRGDLSRQRARGGQRASLRWPHSAG